MKNHFYYPDIIYQPWDDEADLVEMVRTYSDEDVHVYRTANPIGDVLDLQVKIPRKIKYTDSSFQVGELILNDGLDR